MAAILTIESIIDDESAIDDLYALIGKPYGVVCEADNVSFFDDAGLIALIEICVERRDVAFRFNGSEFIIRLGNYIFLEYFINKLNDNNKKFNFFDLTIYAGDVRLADVDFRISIHSCVHFHFSHCHENGVIILNRMTIKEKFTASKYKRFEMIDPYKSMF